MRSTFRRITSVCAAAMLLGACRSAKQRVPAEGDPDALNAGPQREYAEVSIEAQVAAMRRIEAARRRSRVEGLRSKIPPAEWISMAYHGLVLDANFDVIEMDSETVSRIQESMFSVLHEPVRDEVARKHGDLEVLFYDEQLRGTDRLVTRSAILKALLAESDSSLRAQYEWRHRLLRHGASTRADGRGFVPQPEALEKMRRFRLLDEVPMDSASTSAYVESCRAEQVPIPPNWPDAKWISQGILRLVLISKDLTAEVFTYKDPDVPGVCYALPRRDGAESIQLLGIICQSDTTGKACFWDNRTVEDELLSGIDLRLNINEIGNGSTLGETCTDCHRGDNVFNIHPGTALDPRRRTVVGGPYDVDPEVRFTPIGQAHWSNPGPLVLPGPPSGQRSCTACHELPELGGTYCRAILEPAAMATMPPSGADRAGWPPMIHPKYQDHIGRLAAGCP